MLLLHLEGIYSYIIIHQALPSIDSHSEILPRVKFIFHSHFHLSWSLSIELIDLNVQIIIIYEIFNDFWLNYCYLCANINLWCTDIYFVSMLDDAHDLTFWLCDFCLVFLLWLFLELLFVYSSSVCVLSNDSLVCALVFCKL